MAKPDPKDAAKDPAPAKDAAVAPAPAKGGIGAMLPLILAVVVAPGASWAVAEFVLLPRLRTQLTAAAAGGEGAAAGEGHAAAPAASTAGHGEAKKSSSHGGGGHGGKEGAGAANTFQFSDIVVNLAGTMGTRYLKTTFIVTGSSQEISSLFQGRQPQLTDTTIGVLSSLTLADLEEPGSKNILREKLVNAYNGVLGSRIVEQVYFADFVIQ